MNNDNYFSPLFTLNCYRRIEHWSAVWVCSRATRMSGPGASPAHRPGSCPQPAGACRPSPGWGKWTGHRTTRSQSQANLLLLCSALLLLELVLLLYWSGDYNACNNISQFLLRPSTPGRSPCTTDRTWWRSRSGESSRVLPWRRYQWGKTRSWGRGGRRWETPCRSQTWDGSPPRQDGGGSSTPGRWTPPQSPSCSAGPMKFLRSFNIELWWWRIIVIYL